MMEPTATPNSLSKAEYARYKGVHRSNITRWAAAGRVRLDEDGNVLVAESEQLLANTADPEKAGVVKRHEVERGAPVVDLLTPATPAPGAKAAKPVKSEHYNARVRESARHEAAKAEKAEIELAQLKGQLVDAEGVRKAMVDFATLSRQTYERIRPALKLRLAAESHPDKIDELLKTAIDAAAKSVSELLTAQLDASDSTQQ